MPFLFFGLFAIDILLAVCEAGPKGNKKHYAIAKTLLLPLLFLACAAIRKNPPLLPFLSLFFGWLGDICLLKKKQKKLFLAGMLFFAAGHIAYSIACLRICGTATLQTDVLSGLFFLIYIVLLILGKPRLTLLRGKLSAAATVYGLILAFFGFSAARCCLSCRTLPAAAVLVGSLLFIFSDSLLSVQAFRQKTPHGNMFVIGSYALAQACISAGLILLY